MRILPFIWFSNLEDINKIKFYTPNFWAISEVQNLRSRRKTAWNSVPGVFVGVILVNFDVLGHGKTSCWGGKFFFYLTMKVMMFCVFWHKTLSTENWWNRENRKIVELIPLLDIIGFNNLNDVQKTHNVRRKTCSIAQNTTQAKKIEKRFVFPHSTLNNSSKEYFQDCD